MDTFTLTLTGPEFAAIAHVGLAAAEQTPARPDFPLAYTRVYATRDGDTVTVEACATDRHVCGRILFTVPGDALAGADEARFFLHARAMKAHVGAIWAVRDRAVIVHGGDDIVSVGVPGVVFESAQPVGNYPPVEKLFAAAHADIPATDLSGIPLKAVARAVKMTLPDERKRSEACDAYKLSQVVQLPNGAPETFSLRRASSDATAEFLLSAHRYSDPSQVGRRTEITA